MNSFREIIKKSDTWFVLTFLSLIGAPVLMKLALSGPIGPAFEFFFFIFWIPCTALALSMLRGWRETAITASLLVAAFLISFVTYPESPAMDFRRQLVSHASFIVFVTALVAIAAQIFLRRSKSTHRPS